MLLPGSCFLLLSDHHKFLQDILYMMIYLLLLDIHLVDMVLIDHCYIYDQQDKLYKYYLIHIYLQDIYYILLHQIDLFHLVDNQYILTPQWHQSQYYMYQPNIQYILLHQLYHRMYPEDNQYTYHLLLHYMYLWNIFFTQFFGIDLLDNKFLQDNQYEYENLVDYFFLLENFHNHLVFCFLLSDCKFL